MNSNNEPAVDEQARMHALQSFHGQFPSWRKDRLYDAVTSMYQDCHDDEEIARTLATQSCRGITGQMVNKLRLEAASVAENLSCDMRRKWIYRFRRLTVNNLVKEYMFMEGKKNFIQAKRELAGEVEHLLKNATPDRLCIAVNDALGRNNISPDLIVKLAAYAVSARKIEAFVGELAGRDGVSAGVVMEQASRKLGAAFEKEKKNLKKTLVDLAEIFGRQVDEVNEDDAELLLEYCKVQDDGAGVDDGSVSERMKGADIFSGIQSLTEQALSENGRNLGYRELVQIIELIRSRPVMSGKDLQKLKSYAKRHIGDIETMRKLTGGKGSLRDDETKKLDAILSLVERHTSLTDAKLFLSGREIRQARSLGLNDAALDGIMDFMNSLEDPRAVENYAATIQSGYRFDFPVARYIEARFKLPD